MHSEFYSLDILDSITFTYYTPSGSAKRLGLPAYKDRSRALFSKAARIAPLK